MTGWGGRPAAPPAGDGRSFGGAAWNVVIAVPIASECLRSSVSVLAEGMVQGDRRRRRLSGEYDDRLHTG
ncbi:hypothetical protein [Acetobacter nitrogenifigens]|uniref:hypothetical protein n=1 Tax=Acetobacter nitrogenifigens TaxID=285268 RepID=UPI001378BCD2|nr:hypothetical protein [Acetobacter nitrogenifigens]